MKKYIHIGSLQAQSKNHPSKNSNSPNTYRYKNNKDNDLSPKQTLPRSHNSTTPTHPDTYTERKQDNGEPSTPGTRNRTNTQRTLNDRCRTGTNQSQSNAFQDERQIKRDMQGYISKLTDIKNDLQAKIKQLQKMLDNSSMYVSAIDSEYQRLKTTIMEYTSRCLDEAFKKYKKNMPRWSKYQEVEKKGLKIVLELNQFIENQNRVYQQVKQDRVRVNLNSNMKELISRTAHYNIMANEIHKVIEECEEKHPTIREEKVKQFEEALTQLCAF